MTRTIEMIAKTAPIVTKKMSVETEIKEQKSTINNTIVQTDMIVQTPTTKMITVQAEMKEQTSTKKYTTVHMEMMEQRPMAKMTKAQVEMKNMTRIH